MTLLIGVDKKLNLFNFREIGSSNIVFTGYCESLLYVFHPYLLFFMHTACCSMVLFRLRIKLTNGAHRRAERSEMVALDKQLVVVQPERVGDYPHYAPEEVRADATAHALGITGGLVVFGWFASQGMIGFHGLLPSALTLYSICMIVLFCCSAAYHMTPKPEWRPVLRRFDQSAIFFKIAGTYTPLVVLVDSTFSYSLLAMVWVSAFLGAGFKLGTGDRLDRYTVAIYMGISWSAVLLLWSLFETLPLVSASLIVVGGLVYTIGVYFHQSGHIKYNNAIWHAFVLGGSACHFSAIATAI